MLKQIKIMQANQVNMLAFTSETSNSILRLDVIKAEQAKRMAESMPTKIPPYNACDPKTMDVVVRNRGIDNVVRRIVGASEERARADVEQHVGVVTVKHLKTDLPVIAGVQAFQHKTGETMLGAKIICTQRGRRYMYALLNRLGQLQRQSPGNTDYIGVIDDRAIAPDDSFEMVCTFIVTFDALEELEREKFGFYVDTTALQNFNYVLANMEQVRPNSVVMDNFKHWVSAHNKRMDNVLSKFYNS